MSSNLRRDPVCSCPITDYRGLFLDANQLWLSLSPFFSFSIVLFLFIFERKSAKLIRGSVKERRDSLLLLLRSRQGKRDKYRNDTE